MHRGILIFLILFSTTVWAEKIQLQWDPPDGPYDGVKIYQHTAAPPDDVYDFTSPVADIPAGTTSAIIDVPGKPNEVLKYQWVARAYKAAQQSENSNEVSYKVINIVPISPINLTGSYDAENSIIHLTFEQPADPYPINHWQIYYSVDNSDFAPLGTITDPDQLTLEEEFNAVPPGETKAVVFRAVSFRRSGVYSIDSNSFELVIDRAEVGPVKNLRINLEIPVI